MFATYEPVGHFIRARDVCVLALSNLHEISPEP